MNSRPKAIAKSFSYMAIGIVECMGDMEQARVEIEKMFLVVNEIMNPQQPQYIEDDPE